MIRELIKKQVPRSHKKRLSAYLCLADGRLVVLMNEDPELIKEGMPHVAIESHEQSFVPLRLCVRFVRGHASTDESSQPRPIRNFD